MLMTELAPGREPAVVRQALRMAGVDFMLTTAPGSSRADNPAVADRTPATGRRTSCTGTAPTRKPRRT